MTSPLKHFITKLNFNDYVGSHNICCTELMTMRIYCCFSSKITMTLYSFYTESCNTDKNTHVGMVTVKYFFLLP